MNHLFFIHSSINGHSGGFQILAIVNSAVRGLLFNGPIMPSVNARRASEGEIAEDFRVSAWNPFTLQSSTEGHYVSGSVSGTEEDSNEYNVNIPALLELASQWRETSSEEVSENTGSGRSKACSSVVHRVINVSVIIYSFNLNMSPTMSCAVLECDIVML